VERKADRAEWPLDSEAKQQVGNVDLVAAIAQAKVGAGERKAVASGQSRSEELAARL